MAADLFTTLITIAAGLVLLPALILFIQVIAAGAPAQRALATPTNRARIAVIIPAHNEEGLIRDTVADARKQLTASDRVVVVADNCSDGTGSLARQAGAEVVVRDDPVRIGKGYALQAGVEHLRKDPPEAVVVLDADCSPGKEALQMLGSRACKTGRPVQGLYLMRARQEFEGAARLGEFAWRIKNDLRPTGFSRLGLPCQLMGTGMAFPWELIRSLELATEHITEDLLLSVALTLQGKAPQFCRSALVVSDFPESHSGRETQRTRWIHGQLLVVRQFLPKLLVRALAGDKAAAAMAADLIVLPLGIVAGSCILMLSLSATWFLLSGAVWPVAMSTAAAALFISALLLAWHFAARDLIGRRELRVIPKYLLMILRIFVKFVSGRRSAWTRAERKRPQT